MKILDIDISSRTQSFIKEVESNLGSTLDISFGKMTIGANETLMCSIVDNRPIIIVKENSKLTEENLVHELWHLYMKSKTGIYNNAIDNPLLKYLLKGIHPSTLMNLLAKSHSILQHKYFFDKMLLEGYYPSKYIHDGFANVEVHYPLHVGYENAMIHQVALDVAHISIGINEDRKRVNTLLEIIKTRCENAFELGLQLTEVLNSFKTLEDEPKVYSEMLRQLFNYGEKIKYKMVGNDCVYY
jgi:hypothetical protein